MTLSETLDEEAQASALEDLRQIEAASSGEAQSLGENDTRFSDQLGLIGVALERMTARGRIQQRALSELIDELREALEMKTRLISLEQELDIARQMQQNVLPRRFPDTPGFEIAAVMEPAREVGGDFYDIFQVDQIRVGGIAVDDVSGKGDSRAFACSSRGPCSRPSPLEGAGAGRTLVRLNESLRRQRGDHVRHPLLWRARQPHGASSSPMPGSILPYLATPARPSPPAVDRRHGARRLRPAELRRAVVTLPTGQNAAASTGWVNEAFDSAGAMFRRDGGRPVAKPRRCPERQMPGTARPGAARKPSSTGWRASARGPAILRTSRSS